MAGNGSDSISENHPNANGIPNDRVDGHFTDVITNTEGSTDPTFNPAAPEHPLDVPPLAVGTPIEEILATLVHAINRQGEIIRKQNRRLEAVEESCITRLSTSVHRRRSPRRGDRSATRSRSPRRESPRRTRRSPSPRRNAAVHV
ncbi:hypothetical protein P8452_38754 [Trifolium repens]|nr:hypothetical protein QL285_071115 [Trifolium repens]WJX52666.1 hypothetical protein P8452_38754 [Trifolium repens]